jgi:TM2 domain-containing membrane protein YozV
MARKTPKPNPAIALVLAWLIPGAGHFYVRRRVQGIILFLVITATFWMGMGFGGVLTVDPRADRWWAIAADMTGINGVIGHIRQKKVYTAIAENNPNLADPRDASKVKIDTPEKSLQLDAELADAEVALVYPTDVVARAYAGVAGLLNLLCIFDATVLAMMGSPVLGKNDEDPTVEEVAS